MISLKAHSDLGRKAEKRKAGANHRRAEYTAYYQYELIRFCFSVSRFSSTKV